MRRVPSPCHRCRVNEENLNCHSDCKKYQAFQKINIEVNKRITKDMQKSRNYYKPAVRTLCQRKR